MDGATLFFGAVLGFGAVTALIADAKGHNGLAWFFFGAALAIVAIPAALLLAPTPAALERRALAAGGKKCPACAEVVKSEATVCRYCGHGF